MPRLIVIKGTDEGREYELDGPLVGIGRDANNLIRLTDTEVSRRHAELRRLGNDFVLADVGSANGTFLNKQPVKESVLRSGDQIGVGQSILVYTAGRTPGQGESDLAEHISMISRQEQEEEIPSAIIKTIGETEGSRLLSRPDQVETVWLKNALANLSIMYEASQAVSHILDLDQLLERIMELIFRSIEADRGCIMLHNPDTGQLEPKAVRWREGVNREEKIAISRTIMDFVLREKQGVLVSDAPHDERFSTGHSILRFGIREAICVPMKGRHETLGVLYLDIRRRLKDTVLRVGATSKFSEDHLALAIALAHHAALAVEETRYHQAMLQAERLAAIGQTIAALSHHIKNILQGLRSGSEILKMGLGEKNEQLLQQGWKIVEKNQGRIYDLVMDMLSFSKERVPAIEETDINRIVQDALELLEGRLKEHGVRLEKRLDDTLPKIQVDPEGLHRALLNVLTNALDALEERKSPQVAVGTMPDPEEGWVRIVVLDNGVGIPPEKISELFKPFASTKGSRGTGLGLAVSRKIIREHGGDILVQSQVGKGTKFTFRLPVKNLMSLDSLSGFSLDLPPEPD